MRFLLFITTVKPADKPALRKQLRQQRRQLSRSTQVRAAHNVCLRIMRTRWWRNSHRIGFYWPADGEIDLLPLLRRSLRVGKQCYFPVIRENDLVFREFRSGVALRRNRYGIPEPQSRDAHTAGQLDMLLLPLVAFDACCNRLGMGAGFYDRTLAQVGTAGPVTLGIAHAAQRVPLLPIEPWDVPLHAVVTDRRIYRRQRK